MPDATGLRCYQENSVTTIGPEKLIVMLYDGLARYLQQARAAIAARDMAAKSRHLSNAQAVVLELRNALDHSVGGPLAANLEALYTYVFNECMATLLDNDTRHLDDCLRVLAPLQAAWSRIPPGTAERARREQAGGAPNPAAAGPLPATSSPLAARQPAPPPAEAAGGGAPGPTLSIAV